MIDEFDRDQDGEIDTDEFMYELQRTELSLHLFFIDLLSNPNKRYIMRQTSMNLE